MSRKGVWRQLGSYEQKQFVHTVLDKIFENKSQNQAKLETTTKIWYIDLPIFWLQLSKFYYWKGDYELGTVSTQIWDLSNTS